MEKASNGKTLFNEMTRVQMPALVHLTRLGYTYYGLCPSMRISSRPHRRELLKLWTERSNFYRTNRVHKASV